MALITGCDAGVVHQRVTELRTVLNRQARKARTRSRVAHLARLRAWNVPDRCSHDRQGPTTADEWTGLRAGARVTLRAIRSLARRIGMDVSDARHH